jgi:hypothetical protein
MVEGKARRSRGQEPVQGNGSRPESTRGVCGGSPQNCQVTWMSHKTKTGGSVGGDRIRARREASMPADTWRDHRACVERTQTAATTWPCNEEECYIVTKPPKIIPYYRLSLSMWPLSNNKELVCRFCRVKPGESLTTGSRMR